MANIDYDRALSRLEDAFTSADLITANETEIPTDATEEELNSVFSSNTQAFREVFLGCLLAILEDPAIDITKPYINQSVNAFSGRTLDERVVNPFLHRKRVPSSKGPYLSTFRRSVDFSSVTRAGVRDKEAFDSLLKLLYIAGQASFEERQDLLQRLLKKFILLREQSLIPLSKLNRISLIQYDKLIDGLLSIPSGGKTPVMLVASLFRAIRVQYALDWTIDMQGINEADAASSAGGDITVRSGGKVILVGEVTERVVEKSRVVSTFIRKISPEAIEEYIFFVNQSDAHAAAIEQAHQYFAQGSEVNFVDIRTWLSMSLATLGKDGRAEFNGQLKEQLDAPDTSRSIKVAWNDLVERITST